MKRYALIAFALVLQGLGSLPAVALRVGWAVGIIATTQLFACECSSDDFGNNNISVNNGNAICGDYNADFYARCPCFPSTKQAVPTRDCCCGSDHYKRSRTFMFTRPINQHLCIDQAMWSSFIHREKKGCATSFNITAAYQQSIGDRETAQYFLPFCHNYVLVSGDANKKNLLIRDVRAEWLGLPSDFNQLMSLNPKQRQVGCTFTYNQDIGTMFESDLLRGTWIEIKAPVVAVDNYLNFHEFNKSSCLPQCAGPLTRAFTRPGLHYSKLCNHTSTVQLAEVNIKFGRTYLSDNESMIAYYSMASLPSAKKQDPRYLFDAVAGFNQHVGFGGGALTQVLLNRDNSCVSQCFFLNLECLFLIRHDELRTYDLTGKPWSRYLQLVNVDGPLGVTVPAANVLTRDTQVHPYCMVDFSTGFRFKTPNSEFEVGYNVWGHAREELVLKCPFEPCWGIAGDFTGVTPDDLAPGANTVTASESNISKQTPNNRDLNGKFMFVPIKKSDLDLNTGAAQASLNQKMHMAFGYVGGGKKIDGLVGVGGYFDWTQKNTALKAAGAWAKVGASF